MNWRVGQFTEDCQLIVDCDRCCGDGMWPIRYSGEPVDRDFCPDCGGTGEDYWDPVPIVDAIVTAATLTRAYELGGEHPRLWRPNVKGDPAP